MAFRTRKRRIILKRSLPLVVLGGINYAMTMILFVIANKLTSSANAIVLQYTAPVWASVLGLLFLKERPQAEHWGALVLVSGGMFIVFKNNLGGGALTGDILALISGISFGANAVILRKAKDQNPEDIILGANIIAGIVSLPFFLLYPPEWSASNIIGVSFLGFVQIGAASALFAYGIQRVTVIQTALLTMIEPVLNPVWVLLILGEKPSSAIIAGGCIILFAIVASALVTKWRSKT